MHKLGKILSWTVLCISLVMIAGCSPSDRGAVSGQVLLDDQPVNGGSISFIPAGRKDPPAPTAWSEIKEGRYTIPAKKGPGVGVNRVEIHWVHETGRKIALSPPDKDLVDETAEFIPARYHSPSELEVEIKRGNNEVNFDLTSK